MTSKQIIVTGGAGFIGSHIARRLISEGLKVFVIDNLTTGKEENVPDGADFIKLDLGVESNYKVLNDLSCEAVFHLSGQSSGEASFMDPFYDFRSHVMSTFWLLRWCKERAVPRFIYASSMSVYGNPKHIPVDESQPLQPRTFYSAAKISAEAYIKLYQNLGINTTIFRLFSVYGPGQNLKNKLQGMASIYLSYMLEAAPIAVKGSKERYRDFVYIDDVVEAWISAFHNTISYGKIYNVASEQKIKVEDLINALKECFGMPDYPVLYKDGTPGDQFGIVGDSSLIMKDLNWKPKFDLKAGLKEMVDFEKSRLKTPHKDVTAENLA